MSKIKIQTEFALKHAQIKKEYEQAKAQYTRDVAIIKQQSKKGIALQLLRNEFIARNSKADKLLNFIGLKRVELDDNRHLGIYSTPKNVTAYSKKKDSNTLEKIATLTGNFIRPGGVGGILLGVAKPLLISASVAMLKRGIKNSFLSMVGLRRKKRKR